MKKNQFYYGLICAVLLLIGACAKDSLWHQEHNVPEDQKGTIVGQLINDDDNLPLKGIKILFERQTKTNGENTFVDTVSTDEEGRFSYKVPFPNKVRLAIRDTGRYAADTTYIEILEHKDYNITMNSHPRYGVMPIRVNVNNTDVDAPFIDVHVSLWVRETNNESYSLVESMLTNQQGNVQFENIAWPVNYKVRIEEDPLMYDLDSLSGKIITKDQLSLTLNSSPLFGQTTITASVVDAANVPFEQVKVALLKRQNEEEQYVKAETLTTNAKGKVVFQAVDYPVQYKIVLDEKAVAYDYEPIEGILNKQRVAVSEHIVAKSNFGVSNVKIKAWWFFQNQVAANERILVSYKSILDDDFNAPVTLILNGSGEYTFPDFSYPAEIRFEVSTSSSGQFQKTSLYIGADNAMSTNRLNLYDLTPRYTDFRPPSDVKNDNAVTLFYQDANETITGMATDSRGNLYAVTNNNQLIKFTKDGVRSVVAGSGIQGSANGDGEVAEFRSATGIAVQNDTTLYVIENTSAHTIRKVIIDRRTGKSKVSLFSGTYGSTQGSDNVSVGAVDIASAKYNRPSSAVYDKGRHCLWVSEWQGKRIRKIDLTSEKVTTVISATDAYGIGFFNSVAISPDGKYLYIASHSDFNGVYKYDILADKLYSVRTGYSFRYMAVGAVGDPNMHRVFTTIDGLSYSTVYSLINESLVSTSAGNLKPNNTTTGLNQMAGNNNVTVADNLSLGIAQKQIDGTSGTKPFSKNSTNIGPYPLAYDLYTGRLYVSSPFQKSVFYITLW